MALLVAACCRAGGLLGAGHMGIPSALNTWHQNVSQPQASDVRGCMCARRVNWAVLCHLWSCSSRPCCRGMVQGAASAQQEGCCCTQEDGIMMFGQRSSVCPRRTAAFILKPCRPHKSQCAVQATHTVMM